MNEQVENVAEDSYWQIAETMQTKDGYSVQEHVEIMRQLFWEALCTFGRNGANADVTHANRKLWERMMACMDGRLEDAAK